MAPLQPPSTGLCSAFPQGGRSGAEGLRVGVGSRVPAAAGGGGWAQRERQAEAMLPSPGLTCLAQPPLPSYQAKAHLETLCCNSGLRRCPQRHSPVV